jgi:hypothetical protein
MHNPQDNSLYRFTGNSLIAFSVTLAVSGFLCSISRPVDCGFLFIILVGQAVRMCSRNGVLIALVLSGLWFLCSTAGVVSVAAHGLTEVSVTETVGACCFSVWALLNMAWLAQLRRMASSANSSGTQEPAAAAPEAETPSTTPDGVDHHVIASASTLWQRRFPQFTIRSLFVLTILVALACALGTQPLRASRSTGMSWGAGLSRGGVEAMGVQVYTSPGGVPLMGFLWREQGTGPVSSPKCFEMTGSSSTFRVGGQYITPNANFILYYNDADDKPQRLEIPRDEASKVFGNGMTSAGLEQFWRKRIEPLRKAPLAPSARRAPPPNTAS